MCYSSLVYFSSLHMPSCARGAKRELRERVKKMSRVYVIVGSKRGGYIIGRDLQYVSSPERDLVPEGQQPMAPHWHSNPPTTTASHNGTLIQSWPVRPLTCKQCHKYTQTHSHASICVQDYYEHRLNTQKHMQTLTYTYVKYYKYILMQTTCT